MRRSSRRYYDSRIPETLIRPFKDRPKKFENWTYMEKAQYGDMVEKNWDTLEYVYKNHELPPGFTAKMARELQILKMLSQRKDKSTGRKYWDVHKDLREDFEE